MHQIEQQLKAKFNSMLQNQTNGFANEQNEVSPDSEETKSMKCEKEKF